MENFYNELIDKAYDNNIEEDDLSRLTNEERLFYVLYTFNIEIENGGLCQFFTNSSKAFASYISEYLNQIGALEIKELFDNFIKNNNIDLNDLSFFDIDDLSEFEEKVEAYPFEEFDDNYFTITPSLDDYLEKYYNNVILK